MHLVGNAHPAATTFGPPPHHHSSYLPTGHMAGKERNGYRPNLDYNCIVSVAAISNFQSTLLLVGLTSYFRFERC